VCAQCTFINPPNTGDCRVCSASRTQQRQTTSTTITTTPTSSHPLSTLPLPHPHPRLTTQRVTQVSQIHKRIEKEALQGLSLEALQSLRDVLMESYNVVTERKVEVAWEAEHSSKHKEESECVVCLERPRAILFAPCNHLCCCPSCSASMRECPLCRKPINTKVTVFMS